MTNTYVINLDKRPDRWKKMKERFSDSEFTLRRISAVQSFLPTHGNFLSVIKAIKAAKRDNADCALILEDDCLPVRGFLKKWHIVKEWLDSHSEKWDLYSGGALNISAPKLLGRSRGIKFYDPFWFTSSHFIYLRKKSYDLVLNHYKQFSFFSTFIPILGIDNLNNFLRTVVSSPFVAYQDSGFSDIRRRTRKLKKEFSNSEEKLERNTSKSSP
jgi:hypothetical protein